MPTLNETRVRVEGLSKMHRDGLRPGQRLVAEPVGLHRVGQVEHLAPARPGSGRRRAGSAGSCSVLPSLRRPSAEDGRAARPANSSASSSVRISGGASRITSGPDGVDEKPGVAGGRARPRRPTRPGERRCPTSRPLAAHLGDQRVVERREPGAQAARRPRRTLSSRSSRSIVSSTASAAAQATGLPPKVRAVAARREQLGRRARAPMQAPIGRPPPRPLASVTTSGTTPVGLAGEPVAGAADAGLDLVEDQQRAVPRADLAGPPRGSRPAAATTPPSPWIGSRKTAAVSSSTAAAQRRRRRRRHEA